MTREGDTKLSDYLHEKGLGRLAFAISLSGLGVLGLVHGDFALQWQPVPKALPWYQGLAYLSGILLLAGGGGLLIKPIAARCAMGLTVYLLVCWVFPQALKAVPAPFSVAAWLGFCETLAVTTGAWILIGSGGVRIAQSLFGLSCVVFGLSHFVYADFTAGMIPHWLPARLGLAYVTGIGHVVAGLGILFTVRPRLAATLEALMMSSFVILVHVYSLLSVPPPDWAPSARIQWTALFLAGALAASAWIVAQSLRERPSA
jgi:uncharacterized membrane protein